MNEELYKVAPQKSREERDQFAREYLEGLLTSYQFAEKYGIKHSTLRSWVDSYRKRQLQEMSP